MHALSISTLAVGFAALACAAPLEQREAAFTGPTAKGPFALEVIATGGNLNYSGMFLGTYHTGAGLNALVAYDGQIGAQTYNFTKTSGDVSAILGDYAYSLSDSSSNLFAPPKGYHFFGFNIIGYANATNLGHNNYTFSQPGNYLQFPDHNIHGLAMAVCPAQIYSKGYYVPTLVFREENAKKNKTCADVMVKAIF